MLVEGALDPLPLSSNSNPWLNSSGSGPLHNTRLLQSEFAPRASSLSFRAPAFILPGSRNANR